MAVAARKKQRRPNRLGILLDFSPKGGCEKKFTHDTEHGNFGDEINRVQVQTFVRGDVEQDVELKLKRASSSLRRQGLWVTYDHGLRDGGGAAGESWWRQGGADITGEDACRDLEWK